MNRVARPAVLVDLVLLLLAMALVAAVLWPIYRSPQFLLLAVVAVVLGTLLALAGAIFRWPSWALALATVGVFGAVGVPLAVPSQTVAGVFPSLTGLVELFASVVLGWKQLVTITLPVGDYQALLVPALVLLLGSTVTSGSIMLRTRRGEFAAVPPAVAFLVAIAIGPTDPSAPVLLGLSMFVVCLVWASSWRWRRRRALTLHAESAGGALAPRGLGGVRSLLGGLVILAVISTSAVVLTSATEPSRERNVLRSNVVQPFDPRAYTSPLSGFRSYLREGRSDRVMMTVTGLPLGARIRLAALDSYDGVVYGVSSAGAASGSGAFVRLPSAIDRSEVQGERVTLDVEIEGYEGVWVPTVGLLGEIAFTSSERRNLENGFVVNLASGTAAELSGVGNGVSYRLDAVLPEEPSLSELTGSTPGAAEVAALPQLPDDMVTALDGYLQGVTGGPGAQLSAAVESLRANGYISHGLSDTEPVSRSGHSIDRIDELFSSTRMIGDAEQYAVAAALMADRLGFPVRVVMGFVPLSEGVASTTVVHGSDISAWIEVDTAEFGWVALDPVPPVRPIPEERPDDPTPVSRPESVVPPPADRPDPREDQTVPDTTAEDPATSDETLELVLQVLRVAGISVLVVFVVLAPFLLVLAAKARRGRKRRNASGALARIRGGWDEFADLVADHGIETPPAATRAEFADAVGSLPSRVLAAVVDRAVFAPDEAGETDADRVWVTVGELRHSLNAGRKPRERWRARVSLRSFGVASTPRIWARSRGRR